MMAVARQERNLAEKNFQVNPAAGLAGLTFAKFYSEEARLRPDKKHLLKLAESVVPDFPYFTHLILVYQWEEALPGEDARNLAARAIAYISCAIYDAASHAGLFCQPSPIPNGRRPAWILEGERSPVSLTISDIDEGDRICQVTIGAVLTEIGKPHSDRARWERLHAAFEATFSEITV